MNEERIFAELFGEADDVRAKIIRKAVGEIANIPIEVLTSKKRNREIVEARQIAMTLTKQETKLSLKSIGKYYENRDHSTVIHATRTVEDLLQTSKQFKNTYELIRERVLEALTTCGYTTSEDVKDVIKLYQARLKELYNLYDKLKKEENENTNNP